ncbi:MAG: hypothetical protein ABI907_10925 [Ramlibacter sp.]
MNNASNDATGGSGKPASPQAASQPKPTPNTDMQPQDSGTADSGNTDSGTAAKTAMKQTSKTAAESGDSK